MSSKKKKSSSSTKSTLLSANNTTNASNDNITMTPDTHIISSSSSSSASAVSTSASSASASASASMMSSSLLTMSSATSYPIYAPSSSSSFSSIPILMNDPTRDNRDGRDGRDGGNQEVLAEIFSKIAAFEETKTDAEYLQQLMKIELTPEEKKVLESEATDAIDAILLSSSSSSIDASDDTDRVNRLLSLFDQEINVNRDLEQYHQQNLLQYKTMCRKESGLLAEKNALLVSLEKSESLLKELQEVCRTMQKKNKVSMEEVDKLKEAESHRTRALDEQCQKSIDDVLASLNKEEEVIQQKAQENEELAGKLDKFRGHLDAHRKQVEAQNRAFDIQAQLIDAKRMQVQRHREQCHLLHQSYDARAKRLISNVIEVASQVKLYREKFIEFELSIENSKKLGAQYDDKRAVASARATALEQTIASALGKAEARHKELDSLRLERMRLDQDKADFDAQCVIAEKDCRALAARRVQLTKEMASLTEAMSGNNAAITSRANDIHPEDSDTIAPGGASLLSSSSSSGDGASEEATIHHVHRSSPAPGLTVSVSDRSRAESDDSITYSSYGDSFASAHHMTSATSSTTCASSSSSRRTISEPLSPGED